MKQPKRKHSETFYAIRVGHERPYFEESRLAKVPALFMSQSKAETFIDGFCIDNAEVVKVEIREL